MKIKKTVSEKVIRANRANAQKSPGPEDCTNVKHNAMKHGFRAKQLFFENAEEEERYNALLEELAEYNQPEGPIEWMLVEEITTRWWLLQALNGWKVREIADRRKAAKAILRIVAENHDEDRLPLFTKAGDSESAVQLGWDCRDLIVRTGSKTFEQEQERKEFTASVDKTEKGGHVQIEAKLNMSLDTILRYEAALKRDLYRALQTLREIQQQRRGK